MALVSRSGAHVAVRVHVEVRDKADGTLYRVHVEKAASNEDQHQSLTLRTNLNGVIVSVGNAVAGSSGGAASQQPEQQHPVFHFPPSRLVGAHLASVLDVAEVCEGVIPAAAQHREGTHAPCIVKKIWKYS